MTRHGSPVTIRWGSRDPAAPLIVLFHGRAAKTASELSGWIEARLGYFFGPRDEDELEIVAGIVRASHSFAADG